MPSPVSTGQVEEFKTSVCGCGSVQSARETGDDWRNVGLGSCELVRFVSSVLDTFSWQAWNELPGWCGFYEQWPKLGSSRCY